MSATNRFMDFSSSESFVWVFSSCILFWLQSQWNIGVLKWKIFILNGNWSTMYNVLRFKSLLKKNIFLRISKYFIKKKQKQNNWHTKKKLLLQNTFGHCGIITGLIK